MHYVSLMIAIAIFAVIIVAYVQIITKAGYSPWWILLPLAMPVMYIVTFAVLANDTFGSAFGTSSVTTLTNDFQFLGTIDLLVGIANLVMFLVFAFSEWPVMREARTRRPPPGGMSFMPPTFGGPGGPGGPATVVATAPTFQAPAPMAPRVGGAAPPAHAPPPHAPPAPAPPPAAPTEQSGETPTGWYRTGVLGAGEQSYWDGQTWTARRIWNRGAWKALPLDDEPMEERAAQSSKG